MPAEFSDYPSVMDLLQLPTFCSCNNLHDRSATFCISVLQKTDILWFDFCCLDVSSTVLKSLVEIHITLTQEPVRECHIYDSFQLFLACRYQACAVTDEAEGVNDIPFDIIVMLLMRLYQYNRGTSFIHLITQFSCKILFI